MCQVLSDPAACERVGRATTGDLERRHHRREQIERLMDLARHLPPADSLLLRQVFEYGVKTAEIAAQARRSRASIYRRLRALIRRLRSPMYGRVIALLPRLTAAQRRTARRIILQGQSHRQAAADMGITLHQVRRLLQEVRIQCLETVRV